ncbi:MAG: MoxR family ATPase [Caldilineaceae bacterium]|nr:MoxR family ATPase [Caldilineaceae bacterium]HRJ43761.1 MoxR family ATPase [Caldilineaceae bacterium]
MSEETTPSAWPIFRGNRAPHDGIANRPEPPPWRRYEGAVTHEETLDARAASQPERSQKRGRTFYFRPNDPIIQRINTALFLRRPLLVTGKPGTGKSSLAHAVAYELKLGQVLEWPITSRSTLAEALYRYDAIGRLQESQMAVDKEAGDKQPDEKTDDENGRDEKDAPADSNRKREIDIGRYIRLGPLGTALLPGKYPRVLLIDEIDKSDIDLPNDLLHVFEEGGYEIPELTRLQEQTAPVYVRLHESKRTAPVERGRVQCSEFPFVVMTSNGERELPPAFLRRCIRVEIPDPSVDDLMAIIANHFADLDGNTRATMEGLAEDFAQRIRSGDLLATDQLLNATFLIGQGIAWNQEMAATVLRPLNQFRSE